MKFRKKPEALTDMLNLYCRANRLTIRLAAAQIGIGYNAIFRIKNGLEVHYVNGKKVELFLADKMPKLCDRCRGKGYIEAKPEKGE